MSFKIMNPYNILGDDAVRTIHEGALRVLEKTGAAFQQRKTLEILEDIGCTVDFDKQRARIPAPLVEEAIRRAPSSFVVKGRGVDNWRTFGGGVLNLNQYVGSYKLDVDTGGRKLATKQDVIEAARLTDALENIDNTVSPYFEIDGVHPVMAVPVGVALTMKNTSKMTGAMTGNDYEIFTLKMAEVTGQEIGGVVACDSPLTWGEAALESGFRFIAAGTPVAIFSGITFATNGPATLAGSLVLYFANVLSFLVLLQHASPGHRCSCGSYAHPLDMKTMQPCLGAIEKGLFGMAFAQICRHYDIPCSHTVGSDAKLIDYQCAVEKAANLFTQALAGFSGLGFSGIVYDEFVWSPVMHVIDNDIAGMVGRMLRGIDVNEETLALDVIEEVGPIPGNYLATAHTRQWWKKEWYIPLLSDRQAFDDWAASGKKDIVFRAKARMDELLKTHQPLPLTREQERGLDEIVNEAESYYRQRDMI